MVLIIQRSLLLALLLSIACPAFSQTTPADPYFDLVRERYDGKRALAATAYVAQWWRLPGNAGFDSSIYHVRDILEGAGYVPEEWAGPGQRLTYRLERLPMERPAWEPVTASLRIAGEKEPLLTYAANRNLIAINSFSTPEGGVEADLVYLPGCGADLFEGVDVRGKIVLADCHSYYLFRRAVLEWGALGVLSYQIPGYNQPERYPDNIPFRSIPYRPADNSWCLNLSHRARQVLLDRLQAGPVRLRVEVQTRHYPSEELMLVAEVRGSVAPEERFVFSAHVQEPGANDNASGVGCLAEIARVAGELIGEKTVDPQRTLTFLWGDEIDGTRRYLEEDVGRAQGIRWGLSLDMVGEDTEQTGGTFLIEKMPDPSAIWTRGEDRHTEWGAADISQENLFPHYFNDYLIHLCRQQGRAAGWTIRTNPFEGGSDHQPFLDAGIPGVLFWHFTDVFYHTDGDRIDKVSARTLYNVGVSSLVSALTLAVADEKTAGWLLELIESEALRRLDTEYILSREAVARGRTVESEAAILTAWSEWYRQAIGRIGESPVGGATVELKARLERSVETVGRKGEMLIGLLKGD